ncbi:biotin carboxylase N-terminal domain-containing protein [Pikeienuella piscinae]|uniref:ATP-binding protein n=1 Tax=Pikeienuella piscinae TaxID=2748098 RepID=UPI001BA89E5C|nr:biotin carboxylase N-terminal domain-containing protein [Pikeienuella piscinae]
MPKTALLIANRGEIAIRIARAARDMGVRAFMVYSEHDAGSLHLRAGDEAVALPGRGAAAYLDMGAMIGAARDAGCGSIHPGYGFLAENGNFARACAEAGVAFIGPSPEHLDLFGDKARAREAAQAAEVPVIKGIDRAVTLDEAKAFFAAEGPVMLKAVAGGGGRGARAVLEAEELEPAYRRCASEAKAAFDDDALYVEAFIPRARHVEVQILGDLHGAVTHLFERECSVQRRFQKLVEIAPAPALDDKLRREMIEAALRLAGSVGYRNLGTFEFLIDITGRAGGQPFIFIEANARLQV